jgi:hypothetical protein
MPVGELWTDDELRAALEAYLFVQRIEQAGLVISEERLVALLQDGPLPARNDTSIRFRMRNISAVFRDLGRPTIAAYAPAAKVGTGVQARIEAMLREMPQLGGEHAAPSETRRLSAPEARDKAKEALSELAAALDALDPGIGHNKPPEPIDSVSPTEELRRAVGVVQDLRREISAGRPDPKNVRSKTEELAILGVRQSWLRGRGTKAVDAAIEYTVPTLMLSLAILIGNAVVALLRLLPFLS